MPSFEQRFYIENPTMTQKLWRNCRLLVALCGAAINWAVRGSALRRTLRNLEHDEKIRLEDWTQ